jgi:dihydrofolate synthase/folylpolyglutamate synthase
MTGRIRFPDLRHWLGWQQSLHPAAIELGLERSARVLQRTGWRPPSRPVVTIGGTNGKGSCVALCDAMLRAGGYRVGTFTSPHLVDYRERIRLDGCPVSEASLVSAFERVADALGTDSLTFFEFNTLAALLVFETATPDVLVLEVGMGGRLDTVNLVDADVAAVVSVGLDHLEWLGPDVETIAREKAGIFRRGRPAIVGTSDPPRSLIEAAGRVGARLVLRGRDFEGTVASGATWHYRDGDGWLKDLPRPALAGAIQVANAATALAALRALSERLPLARNAIEEGLRAVRLAGRFQRIADRDGFEWLLDVAHNPDSARVLAGNLAAYPVRGCTIAVCGMLADKDVETVVGTLAPLVDRWIAAGTDGSRGLDCTSLATRARGADVAMTPGGSVTEAMQLAARDARAGDRVLVFGSFHTVGPALEHLLGSVAGGDGPSVPCV